MKQIIPGWLLFCLYCSFSQADIWNGVDLTPLSVCKESQNESAYESKRSKGALFLSNGKEQWVFRSKVGYTTNYSMDKKIVDDLKRLQDAFEKNGIRLIYLNPPARTLVSSEMLDWNDPFTRQFDIEKAEESYKERIELLQDKGVNTIDFSSLHHWKKINEPLFLKRDIHWSPEGALQTANVAADAIKMQPEYGDLDEVIYKREPAGVKRINKSMLMMTLAEVCDRNVPWEYARVYSFTKQQSEADASTLFSNDLFSDEKQPQIILLGTSFSALDYLGFADSLQSELKRDVLNLSVIGGNYSGAIDQYLHGEYSSEAKPSFVVWESLLHHIPKSESFFRRMIPPVYGGCEIDEEIINNESELSIGINPALVNKKPLDEIFKSDEHFLKFEFDNTLINKFEVKVWYANGKSEKIKIERSNRVDSNGLFFIELNAEPPLKDQMFVAADILLKEDLPHSGTVKTSLCKRKDLNESNYMAGINNE
ncbi:alginate O-acetyltransferase AlgX-related protein [Endozoicomonas arenosclerae]|uniref:alginate O-acetyltransferase AlgX-related protein n=1 Tax=Endozoicomonas arenosclerae TaxID=1633495 RepID=UPI000780F7DB|nr:alginate biosynthesis protein AlgX [Endozoicomonas arenosclerae]